MGSAAYNARRRARKKAARESAGGAGGGTSPTARPAGRGEAARRSRRELEDAYIDEFLSNPMPAHAAGNPSFREFLRARARSMSDEALAAYVNLSRGCDDDDDTGATLRDMSLVTSEMVRGKPGKMGRHGR